MRSYAGWSTARGCLPWQGRSCPVPRRAGGVALVCVTGLPCGGRASRGCGGWHLIGRGRLCWLVETEQQAVPGLVASVSGLAGEVAEGSGELPGVLRSQPERAKHEERVGLGGGDLRGERAERRLGGCGVVVLQS